MKLDYDDMLIKYFTYTRFKSDKELLKTGTRLKFYNGQGNEIQLHEPEKATSYLLFPTDSQISAIRLEMERDLDARLIKEGLTFTRFTLGTPESYPLYPRG